MRQTKRKMLDRRPGLIKSVAELAELKDQLTDGQAHNLIRSITQLFVAQMLEAGHPARQILRITTKLRDAGRRSAPWKPFSTRVPGRPQDGEDGNRISRWLLPEDHKFYAAEVTATLVEVKYYLQLFSMANAPALPDNSLENAFSWLIEHSVKSGTYLDPIQRLPINIVEVVNDARIIQSGHLVPLDRGGKHEPKNSFLMLARSNQLQGNLTLSELLSLMTDILSRHGK